MKIEAEREMESISKRHKGILRPCDVVNFARNKKTALHDSFQWDDKKAGEAHRLLQARQLINVYVEIIPNVNEPVKVFVSLKRDRQKPGGGYRKMKTVVSNNVLRDELLEQAKWEMISMQSKYRMVNEIVDALQTAIDSVSKAKKKGGGKKKRKAV